MTRAAALALLVAACKSVPVGPSDAGPYDGGPAVDVLQHHNGGSRDALYVEPAFTHAAVQGMHLDPGFSATVDGHVYAQPLVIAGPRAMLIVATESNQVSALDAATGAVLWRKTLGAPVPLSQLECGNIDPLGITGTLFVPYGGHYGDCGDYHGTILAIPVAAPQTAFSWRTRAQGGAVWAPSGISSDGTSIFAATGNTFGATSWADGEAVFRFAPAAPLTAADQFYPSNWKNLDDGDVDLGGSGALLVHVPGATPADLAVALGKDGKAYLLDRNHLGGIGGQIFSASVSSSAIITAPAAYRTPSATYIAFHGAPAGGCSGDLTALRISATTPPAATFAWCAKQNGRGSPIATTTDGQSEPLVWAVGSEDDNRLRAFDGDTGAVVFGGGGSAEAMGTVRRFQSPVISGGRVYVAGDGRVYAFRP